MVDLVRQILIELLTTRRTDATQRIVASKRLGHMGAYQMLKTPFDPLGDQPRDYLRTRADQELTDVRLFELVLKNADPSGSFNC